MINFRITIGQKIFAIKATKDNPTLSSKVVRTPVGIQSGLFHDESFSEDKMLYEKRQRRENRPRMIVEQIHDQTNNAIYLPGIDQQKVFRPLWVTVPIENETSLPNARGRVNVFQNGLNIKKAISILTTWITYMDESVTQKVHALREMSEQYFQLKTIIRYKSGLKLGLQPALFDATPIASMESARYIASRESFTGGGMLPGAAWSFPSIKFVLSVPGRKSTKTVSQRSDTLTSNPITQTNDVENMKRSSKTLAHVYPYVIGITAVALGIFLNFFFLQY